MFSTLIIYETVLPYTVDLKRYVNYIIKRLAIPVRPFKLPGDVRASVYWLCLFRASDGPQDRPNQNPLTEMPSDRPFKQRRTFGKKPEKHEPSSGRLLPNLRSDPCCC